MKPVGARNKNGVARIINAHGYIDIFEPSHPLARSNGYVGEHRLVAWAAGLLKDRHMEVHHRNGDKTDNRLDNLEVISHAEHTRRHWSGAKRKPWTEERRKRKSAQMIGNKNWAGIHENPELVKP